MKTLIVALDVFCVVRYGVGLRRRCAAVNNRAALRGATSRVVESPCEAKPLNTVGSENSRSAGALFSVKTSQGKRPRRSFERVRLVAGGASVTEPK